MARQVAFGMYEMLRNNAANIHETSDWDVVFAIIEIVGAGASPDDLVTISFYRSKKHPKIIAFVRVAHLLLSFEYYRPLKVRFARGFEWVISR